MKFYLGIEDNGQINVDIDTENLADLAQIISVLRMVEVKITEKLSNSLNFKIPVKKSKEIVHPIFTDEEAEK